MKYIIKKHYEATETNKNFAGEVKDFYQGKGGHAIGSQNRFPVKFEIDFYAYTTLAAAKRGLKSATDMAKWETGLGHWNVTVSLVEC